MWTPGSELAPQRRWRRYHFDVPLRVVVPNGKYPRIVDGRGTELNEGGVGLFTGADLDVGEQVEVELTVPFYGTSMKFRGVVRNRPSNGYYYGIEFLGTTPKQKGEITLLSKMLQTAAGHLDS